MNHTRRGALQGLMGLGLAATGCADAPVDPAAAARAAAAFVQPWRALPGAFLAPVVPALGAQARPGTGMYVKLRVPTALALRWPELLIADLGLSRLWRADLMANTLTAIASAPVGPQTRLEIGVDHSAWVLDPPSRQVLRYSRDGTLGQTWRTRAEAPSPSSLAPLDGGLALLVADATLGQWAELRGGGATALAVRPRGVDGAPVRVDALAAQRDQIVVLDRAAAAVHRVTRDGRVLETLPAPDLAQAVDIRLDRHGRVWALDGLGRHLLVLSGGVAPRRVGADELGVQHIGGFALDERYLAVSDRLVGQVQVLTVKAPA
ncbi:MAG: hypothetical protein U1F56_10270 [Rubrivivax sp.]